MQKPAHVAADTILSIAPAEQPVTIPVLILHPEVIAHRPHLPVSFPPLSGDPFRPWRSVLALYCWHAVHVARGRA